MTTSCWAETARKSPAAAQCSSRANLVGVQRTVVEPASGCPGKQAIFASNFHARVLTFASCTSFANNRHRHGPARWPCRAPQALHLARRLLPPRQARGDHGA
jgi:hypothetical protein